MTKLKLKLCQLKLLWKSNCGKTQIVRKEKIKRSKCVKTKKKLQNSRIQIITTQKIKLWQKSKSQTQFIKKKTWKGLIVRTVWHIDNWWDVLWAAFCNFRHVFLFLLKIEWHKLITIIFLAGLSEARGCSSNSLMINLVSQSVTKWAFSSHSSTAPPHPNG